LEHSVGHYDKFEKHLKYGSRITLYSSIAFVVFALVALFMACGKESARKTGYCVLALASLVLLLIAAGFMFWIFGVAESSAFCGALRDVNKGELEVMTSRNVSEDFLNFVKSCILEDPSVDYR
jgi:cytosine/uracil/thiamine/allantoin permease